MNLSLASAGIVAPAANSWSLDPKDAGVAMGRYLIDNPHCVDEIRAKMEKRGARL